MDYLIIQDLTVDFRVGVPEAERTSPQRLLITMEMEIDVAAAVAEDDLNRTVDYDAVKKRIADLGVGRSWKLIESLASEIAGIVLREFRPSAVTVEVKKFILPETRWVAVRIRRDLRSFA